MGEWRTVRQPKAPLKVFEALSALTSLVADDARKGRTERTARGKRALDVLNDFVRYEPTNNGRRPGDAG